MNDLLIIAIDDKGNYQAWLCVELNGNQIPTDEMSEEEFDYYNPEPCEEMRHIDTTAYSFDIF